MPGVWSRLIEAADLIKSKGNRLASFPARCLGLARRQLSMASDNRAQGRPFDPAFNEMKFGAWEGKSESSIQHQYPLWSGRLWNSSPHQLKLPGRETLQQLQRRVVERMHQYLSGVQRRSWQRAGQ